MAPRTKSTSSTESSSGSTSDSSSNSSTSSSGSDSGSSSSDSDSSTSQEGTTKTPTTAAIPSGNTSHNTTGTRSGHVNSSNTVNGVTNNSSTGSNVKSNDKTIRRKSSEVSGGSNKIQQNVENKVQSKGRDTRKDSAKAKKPVVYSSDDDVMPSKLSSKPSTEISNKKKSQTAAFKPKTNSNPNTNNTLATANHIGGGKAPPAVVKQAKLSNNKIQSQSNNSTSTNSKKTVEKSSSSSSNSSKANNINKKKSIFSPENSTDSDDVDDDDDDEDESAKIVKTKTISVRKAISDQSKNSIRGKGKDSKLSTINNPVSSNIQSTGSRQKIAQKLTDKEKIVIKSSESSESSSSSGSSSSSDSESETSVDSSSPPPKKSVSSKKQLQKPSHTAKTTDTSKNNSDSENELSKPSVVRKLTRSASTRKSRHLTGKAASETDSDADSVKRSLSKSPVKKAPVATKGKTKNKRSEVKSVESNSVKSSPPAPEERKCPLEGCESLGHLSGHFDKHFTIEACPMFHNLTIAQTKEQLIERKKREEERKKTLTVIPDPQKKVLQTMDQKMYLQKIKEMRMKFKPSPTPHLLIQPSAIIPPTITQTSNNNNNANNNNNNNNNKNNNNRSSSPINLGIEKDKEPNLVGHVCDYDLQLFREAQAVASENIENELKGLPPSKGTKYISMGKYLMEVWYQSPYPTDAARLPKLYICEFCLRYQKSEVGMKRHSAKCVWRHPPGDEIYRKGKLGVWQVDGKRHKQYCQHLCLLAKFFLDHKTLYYDVEPFLFYVMTLADSEGCHTVGYFSKEKNSFLNYNVSCILTLPPYQRKGYGRLLIDFSYLLTRVEGKIGSPEKPLSDLGLISYRSYWKDVLLDYLCSRSGTALSIKDVSQEMAINSYDIVSTLQALGMMKYWKGKHIILKKQDVLEEYAERVKKRGHVLKIDPSCLRWTPFVPPAQTTGPS